MKRALVLLLVIVFSVLLILGCSGNSGNGGSSQSATSEEPEPTIEPPQIGLLGDLIDLGDLVYPLGDHWYFTWARVINDEGTVVGVSNQGDIPRAAFKWEPGSGMMSFLYIHLGNYSDYFGQFVFFPVTPKDFVGSEAVDINETGSIIGNSNTGYGGPDYSEKRAFLCENDVCFDLQPIPGDYRDDTGDNAVCEINSFSEAVDINNKGEVILTLDDNLPGERHAYYWDGVTFENGFKLCQDATPTGDRDFNWYITIPDPIPAYQLLGRVVGESSEAVAINENGQAVVNSGDTVIFHDLNWDVIEVLNHLPFTCDIAPANTVAVDINDSGYVNNDAIPDGHVIGNSGCFIPEVLKRILSYTFLELPEIPPEGPTLDRPIEEIEKVQGFFWDGGSMYPVDHLGGGKSVAADINDKDQVVGGALTADGKTHAFLWTLGSDEKGVITDLGTLGGDNSFALAINEAGQVVGWAETGESYSEQGVVRPVRHAFLWENGQMYDLGVHNDFYDYPFIPPYPFSYAVDINEQGILHALTGNSITINQHSRGFFLSPEMP